MLRALLPRALPSSRASFRLQSVRTALLPPTIVSTPTCAWTRSYSAATPVLDYEAQLRGVIDKAKRNVEAGVRAPTGDDMSLRLIMVAKPGGELLG